MSEIDDVTLRLKEQLLAMEKLVEKEKGSIPANEIAIQIVEEATDLYQNDGDMEIDDLEIPLNTISCGDEVESIVDAGGVYVQFWKWVPIEAFSEGLRNKIYKAHEEKSE